MGQRLTFLALCAFVLIPARAAWADDETPTTLVESPTTEVVTEPPSTIGLVVVPMPRRHPTPPHKNAETARSSESGSSMRHGTRRSVSVRPAVSAPPSTTELTTTTSTTFGLYLSPPPIRSTTTVARARTTISRTARPVADLTPTRTVHWTLTDRLIIGLLGAIAVGAFGAAYRVRRRASDVPVGEHQ